MPVNKKRICLWTKALDSGKFKKTTGQLYRNGAYCVLGVGCKVYEDQTGDKIDYKYLDDDVLPSKVKKWYGLNRANPKVTVKIKPKEKKMFYLMHDMERDSIAEFNDNGYSFKELSKAIKEEFGLDC